MTANWTIAPGSVAGLGSAEGCQDMVMRHWEWCADVFRPTPRADPNLWRVTFQGGEGLRARRGGPLEHLVASSVNRIARSA